MDPAAPVVIAKVGDPRCRSTGYWLGTHGSSIWRPRPQPDWRPDGAASSGAHLELLDGLQRLRAVGERLLQVLAVGHAQVLQPREQGRGPSARPARRPIPPALPWRRRDRRRRPGSPFARAPGAARAPLPDALQLGQVPPAARLCSNRSRPLPPRRARPALRPGPRKRRYRRAEVSGSGAGLAAGARAVPG